MSYEHELFKTYYSTHYQHHMPQTVEGWNWVIDRIELNFGDIFSSIPKDSLILDIACGVGYLEYYLLKRGFTKIEAIDLSEEQVHVAKRKLKEYDLQYTDKVEFKIVDAFDYLKTARGYDLIAMIDLIDHLPKDKALELLQVSFRALNKGGLLMIRATNADNPVFARSFYRDFTHETPFTPDSLRQCLSVSGFDVVKIDYEVIPKIDRGKLVFVPRRLKRSIRQMGLWFLGKLLGITPDAFTEDLIAIGMKR